MPTANHACDARCGGSTPTVTSRAQKQYDATDPDHRLVADELERRWNQALQRVREIEGRIDQHLRINHKSSSGPERNLKIWRRTLRPSGRVRTLMSG
jgi:hypothetical protein